jgi:hypothetical protein
MEKMSYTRNVQYANKKLGVLRIGKKLIASCVPEKTALEIVRRYNNFKEID